MVMSFSVPRADIDRAAELTKKAVLGIDPRTKVIADPDLAVLRVLGVGMRTHTGVARTMFGSLATQGINIAMINTSEICISVAVERADGEKALAGLRGAFGLASA